MPLPFSLSISAPSTTLALSLFSYLASKRQARRQRAEHEPERIAAGLARRVAERVAAGTTQLARVQLAHARRARGARARGAPGGLALL